MKYIKPDLEVIELVETEEIMNGDTSGVYYGVVDGDEWFRRLG